MKIKHTVFALFVVSSSLLVTATSSAATVKVVYSGDPDAKTVCSAIVFDKVNTLKRTLKQAKTHPLDQSHTQFKCNDLDLDQFAQSMEAEKSLAYLQKKFDRETSVTTEELEVAKN